MRETILLFHFTDSDRRKRLTRALLPLGMKMKEVSMEDYGKPMGYLAGIKDFPLKAAEPFLGEGGMSLEELSGEMLVMAGLSSSQVDKVLKAIHKSGLHIPYKAVLTEGNQSWNVWELFQEIKKEHESMSGGRIVE